MNIIIVKIHRKIICLLVCLLFLLSFNVVAYADLIVEPNDDFYSKNSKECNNVARMFTTNGVEGNVVLKKNPESSKTVTVIDNGSTYFVTFTYMDKIGNYWGVIEYEGSTGWVQMSDMELVYDNIEFTKDHLEELKDYTGEFDSYVYTDTPVVLWTYPGSGVISSEIKENSDMVIFSDTYTDQDGRQWGFIAYYYSSDGWVCFSDPTNRDIPVTIQQTNVTIIPPNSGENNATANISKNNELLLLVAMLTALVVITSVIIRIFWKKNTK